MIDPHKLITILLILIGALCAPLHPDRQPAPGGHTFPSYDYPVSDLLPPDIP